MTAFGFVLNTPLSAANLPSHLRPDLPVLFLWGTLDMTATPSSINKARKFIPRLQDVALEGKGHWLMIEAPEYVTKKVIEWLHDVAPSPRCHKL
jgi:soluble epoxide hydrolase/lipid-phosphate phosphatase